MFTVAIEEYRFKDADPMTLWTHRNAIAALACGAPALALLHAALDGRAAPYS